MLVVGYGLGVMVLWVIDVLVLFSFGLDGSVVNIGYGVGMVVVGRLRLCVMLLLWIVNCILVLVIR